MPLPFLLAGLSLAAGIFGAGGHIIAKETNEKTQRISEDAQSLYNSSKMSLEREHDNTEKALLKLGYSKKEILDFSMKQFLQSYEKIKSIEVLSSVGLDEISNFSIDRDEAIQIRKMSDIYSSTISSGATGAAAGAVIALAASGSLPIVTGSLSLAGSTLAMGEIGAAAGIAGSALSFGAAMTPLAAIAAPVVLFTGISASIKADENLEKAQAMYAEAEVASEKMKVSETLCKAIADRSNMFDGVLIELDGMFSECAKLLDAVVQKKSGVFGKKAIKSNNLSEEELKLIAITRSLAGAVKAIIDTPILSRNGDISLESEEIYNKITYKLPAFSEAVKEIESYDYKVKPKEIKQRKASVSLSNKAIGFVLLIIIAISLKHTITKYYVKKDLKTTPQFNTIYETKDIGFGSPTLSESQPFTENDTKESQESIEETNIVAVEETESSEIISNNYILPYIDSVYYEASDLERLTTEELRLARNEVYARHGRIFETEDLNQYFSNQPWYHGYLSQVQFDDSVLNEYEKTNLDLIKAVESGKDDILSATSNTNLEEYSKVVNQVYDRSEIISNDYILPYIDSIYYEASDLERLTKEELRLARNEVYARHGRVFETEDLNRYFSNQPWYHGYLSQVQFDDSVLNEYEKINLDLIKAVESGKV